MEIGNEISHKIRSAIKAKLVELGAYVDEELPDYIMVMVANKKSQFQMSEDLGLFLGPNTDKFTSWLHGLLQKLQSITSDATAATAIPSHSASQSRTSERSAEKSAEKSKPKEQVKLKEQATATEDSVSAAFAADKPKKVVADESKPRKPDLIEVKTESNRRMSEQEDEDRLNVEDSTPEPAASVESNSNHVTHLLEKPQETSDLTEVLIKEDNGVSTVENTVLTNEERSEDLQKPEARGETSFNSDIQVVEDDDLADLLLTENDELTEELEQETAVMPTASKRSEPVIRISDDEVQAEHQRETASRVMPRGFLTDFSQPHVSRPKAVTSPIRQSSHRSSVIRSVTSPTRQTVHRSAIIRAVEPRPLELQTRKRRAPVSVIGSVTHDSDDDDGYDPRSPAVGNVASVVRVTARKSSVPVKLQANKSLLLKAMTEAEKSVESQRRVAITPIRPFMRSEGRDRDRDRDRDSRDERERAREQERHGRSSASSGSRDSSHPSMRLAQTSLRQAFSQSGVSRHSDPPVYIPTRKVQPAPRMDPVERKGIVSRSKRQEAHQRAWLDEDQAIVEPRKMAKADPIVNFVIETELDTDAPPVPSSKPLPQPALVKVKQEPVSPVQVAPVPEASPVKRAKKCTGVIDSRVVEYEQVKLPSPVWEEEAASDSGSQGVPVLLDDMDHDQFTLDVDQDVLPLDRSPPLAAPPPPAVYQEDLRHALLKEKPKEKTRFVVTLDGVDSDHYDQEVAGERFEEGMALSEAQSLSRAATSLPVPQMKEVQASVISPPKIQPMNISLHDSDEEGTEAMEVEPSPLKQAKMVERCKFWPACVNGAACDYHHPTIRCKTFPLCKFGDKCLYIHPNCRYDSKCARPDCPYTHSSRRSLPAFPIPQMVPVYRAPHNPLPVATTQCKYFPACSNLSCPFFHPKPCHFGRACKNKGCPFFHPSLPTKDKLTWAAQPSSEPAAEPAAKLLTPPPSIEAGVAK